MFRVFVHLYVRGGPGAAAEIFGAREIRIDGYADVRPGGGNLVGREIRVPFVKRAMDGMDFPAEEVAMESGGGR